LRRAPASYVSLTLIDLIVVGSTEVGSLLVHRSRDADAAWLGERFEPCRDIDAGPVDILTVGDDLAKIDAHAELEPPVGRHGRVPLRHGLLQLDRTLHAVGDATELHQQAVPRRLNETAVMLGDLGIDQVLA
jgi:hypothetical protein